jgi:hypothetical protein
MHSTSRFVYPTFIPFQHVTMNIYQTLTKVRPVVNKNLERKTRIGEKSKLDFVVGAKVKKKLQISINKLLLATKFNM